MLIVLQINPSKISLLFTVTTCHSRLHSLSMEKALYVQVWMLGSILLYDILQGLAYSAPRHPKLVLKVNT